MCNRVNDKMNRQGGQKDDQKMRLKVQKEKKKGQIKASETRNVHCEIPVSCPN